MAGLRLSVNPIKTLIYTLHFCEHIASNSPANLQNEPVPAGRSKKKEKGNVKEGGVVVGGGGGKEGEGKTP